MTPTPVLTDHARQRCAEMGISTKVAKQIFRNAEVRRPDCPGGYATIATSTMHPHYAVVFVEDPQPVILTVLFRIPDRYIRNGSTYIVERAS